MNRDHLQAYELMDISLDPFPYAGTTTTCESLWMGVPVITLVGNCHAHNVGMSLCVRLAEVVIDSFSGASLMCTIGYESLIAKTQEEYIQIAVNMAKDIPRLQKIRSTLRDTMANSPLCQGAPFTKSLEKVYRDLWRTWCNENPLKDDMDDEEVLTQIKKAKQDTDPKPTVQPQPDTHANGTDSAPV